jgi:hypothetical protein
MRWDTSAVPLDRRVDAIAGLVGELGIGATVRHERHGPALHARLHAETVGPVATFAYAGSGIRMVQTERRARTGPEALAVAVQGRRPGALAQHDHRRLLRPGELLLIDHTGAYDYAWRGDGGAHSVTIALDRLGLPMETVRRACRQVAASPLCGLVAEHVARLVADAARLAGDAGAVSLGEATVELVRALVLTAASPVATEPDPTAGIRRAHGLP